MKQNKHKKQKGKISKKIKKQNRKRRTEEKVRKLEANHLIRTTRKPLHGQSGKSNQVAATRPGRGGVVLEANANSISQ